MRCAGKRARLQDRILLNAKSGSAHRGNTKRTKARSPPRSVLPASILIRSPVEGESFDAVNLALVTCTSPDEVNPVMVVVECTPPDVGLTAACKARIGASVCEFGEGGTFATPPYRVPTSDANAPRPTPHAAVVVAMTTISKAHIGVGVCDIGDGTSAAFVDALGKSKTAAPPFAVVHVSADQSVLQTKSVSARSAATVLSTTTPLLVPTKRAAVWLKRLHPETGPNAGSV